MKKLLLFLPLFLLSLLLNAQFLRLPTHLPDIDSARYQGISGSPYLLSDFAKAIIYESEDQPVEGILANYNGVTGDVEIKHQGKHIAISERDFHHLVFRKQDNPDLAEEFWAEEITLIPTFVQKIPGNWLLPLYESPKATAWLALNFSVDERVVNEPGKNREIKQFYRGKEYYLDTGQGMSPINLNAKQILAELNDDGTLKIWLKKSKNKLKTPADLIALLEEYSK